MAKRKLTKQQKHRIGRIQEERVARASRREEKAEQLLSTDHLGDEVMARVIAHFGVLVEVEDQPGQRYKCYTRAMLPPIVTGDYVSCRFDQAAGGVITGLQTRKTLLSRPDTRGHLKPVAANIDQILIVVSPAPLTPANLIDRYLVAAHASGITPLLVFNKSDLITSGHILSVWYQEYQALGYDCILVSAVTANGLHELESRMADRTSVFVGQSGVGKSSLINCILPDVNTRTAEISESTGKGKHTTTTAVLYDLPHTGALIDSPGIREFGLWHITADQLYSGYPELTDLPGCKFRNCNHVNEPGCSLIAAVNSGPVLERRYRSYLSIRESLDEVEMRG